MVIDNPNLFAGKYRVKSTRLPSWDYSSPGSYFVTICTLNKNKFLGKIENGKMVLSPIGMIAKDELEKTFQIRTKIALITSVIMPNHIHLLILIHTNTSVQHSQSRDVSRNVSTKKFSTISPKQNSISIIIRQFKGMVTSRCHRSHHFFSWQSRYYDEIIKDKKHNNSVISYINSNILHWKDDKLYI